MDTVKVALRVRPLVKSEIESGCRSCIERIPNEPQISIGKGNQMFTFNYVFDENEGQSKVYDNAVEHLIENLFKGYNLTILAYGQTGSGKTYTMGTNYSHDTELGVIPRSVYNIFDKIKLKTDYSFRVTCSFLEVYNESLYDLLTRKPREQSVVDMREQTSGVCIPGLTEIEVYSPVETLRQLQEGSQVRVVGATAMNSQSSRSHAIFTMNIRITNKQNPKEAVTSKFHLVDLAGSERSKKTGATGDRFKEGVNINKGLMALGNVISQLGDGSYSFINYRDSKLTRLLQDSLGGNSVTLMIACVSPADNNQDESVNTLRYADRARKIQNKPVVNQDPQSTEISRLRRELEYMRLKFVEGTCAVSVCPPSHKQLEAELADAQARVKTLLKTLTEYMSQISNLLERAVMAEKMEEIMNEKLNELILLSESINLDGEGDKHKALQDIKSKIMEVQAQKLQFEKELFSHEKSSEINKDLYNEDSSNYPIPHEHILSQAQINKEIHQISQNLLWKEELMAKLSENASGLNIMEGVSQIDVDNLKKQVESLQVEKDELLNLINSGTTNSNKLAEQRRKRLLELEQQKVNLLKKITEQEKIIKLKQNSDRKIKSLQAEIMSMKQLKVKLIQQMKAENERFRSWKAEKDREMCHLRSQNMKKQNQLKKMEQQNSLQQNVLKRKLEAAAAANKRIMAVLERQKQAKLKKSKGTSSERIKEKIQEQLELIESEYQAQKSLESLFQDRASLAKELTAVKESLQDENVPPEEKTRLNVDKKQIEDGIASRSYEIADLQQKLMDIQREDRTNENWDFLQSMGDAKHILSHLFNLLSEKMKENINISHQVSELEEQQHYLLSQFDQYSQNSKATCKEKMKPSEKECEEKVLSPGNDETMEYDKTKPKELDKIGKLRVKELEDEVSLLDKPLAERKPTRNRKKEGGKTFSYELADEESLKPFDLSIEIDNDNPDNDPDWTRTPIFKRLQSLKLTQKRKAKKGKKHKSDGCSSCQGDCTCPGPSQCKGVADVESNEDTSSPNYWIFQNQI